MIDHTDDYCIMKPISQCLNKRLVELCKGAISWEVANEKILEHIPETLRPHVFVFRFQAGNLTLGVQDPVWATPLRYMLPGLRDALRTAGIHLVSVDLRVVL